MDEMRIFHVRFDRTQPEPKQTALQCVDFRQSLYADAMPYYSMGKMMMTDASQIQRAFTFLNNCVAFAQTEKADADIMELENGYKACFYFDSSSFEGSRLITLSEMMRQSDRCIIEVGDMARTPLDEPLCTVCLYVFTHRECVLESITEQRRMCFCSVPS